MEATAVQFGSVISFGGLMGMAMRTWGLVAAGLLCALPSGYASGGSPATNPLWRAPRVRNYLPDMTWPEVAALLKRTDVAIIPVPALEQHGPQGPIGTDFYNGTEEAKLIAQRTDALVAPILLVGNSPYHMGFPGTITLSPETIERVYFEAVQSLVQQGFRKLVFLNAHGGNAAITRFVVDRINQETSATAVDLDRAMEPFEEDGRTPPDIRAERNAEPDLEGFDHHAGVNETSASLYLTPTLVDMAHAPAPAKLTLPAHLAAMLPRVDKTDRTATLLFLSEALKAKSTGKHTSTAEMTPTGVWSEEDVRKASASRGKAFVDSYVNAAVQFIEEWKRLEPLHDDVAPSSEPKR